LMYYMRYYMRYYSSVRLKGLRKITQLTQDSAPAKIQAEYISRAATIVIVSE
jgi:hypothetical protein